MNKDQILNRIEDYKSEQLFDFIKKGIVSLVELKATGNLDASMRRAIQALQKEQQQKDDDAWEKYNNSESGCERYLEEYPEGNHASEAKKQIEDFKNARINEQKEKDTLLKKLSNNPNACSADVMKDYLDKGTLNRNDLINNGIPEAVIDRLYNMEIKELEMGETPDYIPPGFAEVYFWGIPGSGKTCALSAVLSTANKKGYLEVASGPGFDYMTRLRSIFAESASVLPPPSKTDSTQYLPFVLRKGNDDPRSVSLIELSGEIFECFYRKEANQELPSPEHEQTLNSLLRFLDGDNRKLHFFFVDYAMRNRRDKKGYTQDDYLQAAAQYFNRHNIFRKSTDAIYIVVTKSDLMPSQASSEVVKDIKTYLNDANFTAFINSLRNRCRENSINSGKILGTHFSLGKVYFDQICDFDSETSENIIDILIRRIAPNKKSILDVFNK